MEEGRSPAEGGIEGEAAARTLESLGLLGLLTRVRTNVSGWEFLLLLCTPVLLVALAVSALISLLPEAWREDIFGGSTSTTTTTNPATTADAWIEDPDFPGLAATFLGTLAASAAGGLLGLAVCLLDRSLAPRLRSAFPGTRGPVAAGAGASAADGDDGAAHNGDEECGARGHHSAHERPLLERSGECGEMVPFPEVPVHAQLFGVAEAGPSALAATLGEVRLTYGELRSAALAAGGVLQQAGVCEGVLVALYLPGGLSVLVAILGTWAAGGAWQPIDREAPPLRIAALVEDGRPSVVVCDDPSPFREADVTVFQPDASGLGLIPLPGGAAASNGTASAAASDAAGRARPEHVAQVIYTSGSTGVPKGVIFSHRRIAFACHFFAKHCKIEVGTKVLQKTPYIWAVFRHEVFPALCHGGSLAIAEQASRKDPKQLAELLARESVEVLVATPSVLELIVDAAGGQLPRLRVAVCMGEGLQREAAQRILQRCGAGLGLHNFYGSTETENAVFSVPRLGEEGWRALAKRYVPAGRPQPCVSVHILDPDSLDPRPAGKGGEICFGGVMSDGYWRRPELTRERFVDHPLLGRIYRTGDVGLWDPLLGLQVVGRTDRQVKIRGIRIELEEVEASLREAAAAAGGAEAAAVAAPAPGSSPSGADGAGGDHLAIVAFVGGGPGICSAAIRRECKSRMPPYMVPSIIQTLDALPRLPNQKVDLRALSKMAEKAEETVQALDSLGMLRLLSRAQVEEDIWIQNQQAFWMLVVMLGHFQLNGGAALTHGVDPGNWAWRIEMLLGHGKDMVAFILMVGFTDSRDPICFGPRDWVLVLLALLMSGPLAYVLSPGYGVLRQVFNPPGGIPCVQHGWFLYSFMFARLVLNFFHRKGIAPGAQVALAFAAALLFPDDVWDLVPDAARTWLWQNNAGMRYKGFRWSFLFMTACYLLGFHGGAHTVHWARRHAPSAGWQVAALVGASWSAFLAMSALNAPEPLLPWGYSTFQAVYDETRSSHLITVSYMTDPSFAVYVALWFCETLLFILPGLFVAVAMAYCPVHFKTMGTTSLGNYVLHPSYIGAPWTLWVQAPVLGCITSPAYGVVLNVAIVFAWNVAFCVAFAMTLSAAFHHALVGFFGLLKTLLDRRRRKAC